MIYDKIRDPYIVTGVICVEMTSYWNIKIIY